MMRGGGPMGMMMGMADHTEGRIAFLRRELKITDAQMPQWNAFAEALRANARRMSGMHETMMQGGMMNHGNAPMSAPDRLDRMERLEVQVIDAREANPAQAGLIDHDLVIGISFRDAEFPADHIVFRAIIARNVDTLDVYVRALFDHIDDGNGSRNRIAINPRTHLPESVALRGDRHGQRLNSLVDQFRVEDLA